MACVVAEGMMGRARRDAREIDDTDECKYKLTALMYWKLPSTRSSGLEIQRTGFEKIGSQAEKQRKKQNSHCREHGRQERRSPVSSRSEHRMVKEPINDGSRARC